MKAMGKRGQSSAEYIALVAFVMILILPGIYIFLNSSEMGTDKEDAIIDNFARAVISQSERLYPMGPGAKSIINERLPEGVVSISTEWDETAKRYEMTITTEEKEYYYASPVPINASISVKGRGSVITLETQEADGEVHVLVSFGDNLP